LFFFKAGNCSGIVMPKKYVTPSATNEVENATDGVIDKVCEI